MNSMRKWVGFAMALAMAAFALPANAHSDDTINLVMGVAGPNQLTASLKHNDFGDYMKSFKMPFGTNVQSVTVTGVTISPNPPSTMPTVSVTGSGATGLISVSGGMSLKYGQTLKLTLAVTPTGAAGCGSSTSTWTATGWDGTNFSGERYPLKSTGNVLTANINGACTLTYNAGAGGTISGTTPQTVAYGGSGTQVTAVPNAGYNFANWSDSVTTAARTDSPVTANKSVTANFVQINYTISGSTSAGGTVTCTPASVTYGQSSTCSVAINPGYTFTGFSANCGAPTTATSCTVSNVQSGQTVTASFSQIPYAINGSTSAGGTVSCTPSSVFYNGTGTCTVAVNANFTFTGFSANCGAPATATSCTVSNVQSDQTVTASFNANTLAISSTVTSAAKGTPFPVKVTLTGGPQDATVTLVPAGCPAITGSLSAAASGGVANFSLTFTDVGACTLTASAPNYTQSAPLNRVVYAVADPGCDPSAAFPTSISPGNPALDPDADQAYLTTGWGLRRYDNTNASGCTSGVNFTLTTATDGDGKAVASLVYDKLALPAGGNFKYVIVLDPRPMPADGWPALRPQVQWNAGTPEYIDGLACLSDDNQTLGSLVMPQIPAALATANYPAGSYAKMCIAQVGWTPVPAGIQYWVKVIDQSDSSVKFP
jgi:hypothetical protein